jgi:hypothetical protein
MPLGTAQVAQENEMRYDFVTWPENTYNKLAAFRAATETICEFQQLNPNALLSEPQSRIVVNPGNKNFGEYFSERRQVEINLSRCRVPADTPFQWTWPGYTADLSVYGVLTHEFGHFVHDLANWHTVGRAWRNVVANSGEKITTSYGATNTGEDFAESFKLFLTNPDLLRVLFPVRHNFLAEIMELKPVEQRTWSEVLANSQRHIDAVERKLRNPRAARTSTTYL